MHTDIYGPITSLSLDGNRYFLTLTDNFFGKIWMYLLKEKKEALNKFKIFKSMMENQSGHKIKAPRSDRGGEYTSHDFESFNREWNCSLTNFAIFTETKWSF